MIKLSNDYMFDFACGSGALGFDGKGWPWEKPLKWLGVLDPSKFTVVLKTLTLNPIVGNLSLWHPWTCVRLLPNGSVTNCVGLTNPGITGWYKKYYPIKYDYALSIKTSSVSEAGSIVSYLKSYNIIDIKYIELNISCPNVKYLSDDLPEILRSFEYLETAKFNSPIPIVLKLALDQIDERFIELCNPYVDAYHAINTIPWSVIFKNKESPIERYKHKQKGGVSGPLIHDYAINAVKRLKYMTSKPIIGGGGIDSLEAINRFKDAGAQAFSIGTCFLRQPWKPNRIIREYRKGKRDG